MSAHDGGPLLRVENLGVRFGGLAAVSDVSFEVARGTAHGLIGPNGAGKTSAFNLISGLYAQTSGAIALDGLRLDGLPTWARAQAGLARTFQNIRVFQEMTVLENVMTGGHLHAKTSLASILTRNSRFRKTERACVTAAMRALDQVGLADQASRRGGDLAYGDQRLLEIARALANQPKLLMLDEPAAGMNAVETQGLIEILTRLKQTGLSLLLVEHDMHFVMRLCDRITVLNFGKKIAEGVPLDIRRDPLVIEAYLGAAAARGLEGAR